MFDKEDYVAGGGWWEEAGAQTLMRFLYLYLYLYFHL